MDDADPRLEGCADTLYDQLRRQAAIAVIPNPVTKKLCIPSFQTSGFWADNLLKRTGSAWLNISRVGSTIAMGATAILYAWDAGRALRDGDDDVAVANMIAASGSGIWALYTIGLLASPWLLGLGVGLLVTGVIGTVLLVDSAVEQAIKHGPFGT